MHEISVMMMKKTALPVGIRLRGRYTGGLLFLSVFFPFVPLRGCHFATGTANRDANSTANVHQDYQSARTKTKTPPEQEPALLKK